MSLDNAIQHVLDQSKNTASVRLRKGSSAVSDQLYNIKATQELTREADADECKLFHVSNNEYAAARAHDEALRGTPSQSPYRNIERLLPALSALNQICPIPDLAEDIEQLQEEYNSQETNIQFLKTSFDEQRVDLDQLLRASNARHAKHRRVVSKNERREITEEKRGVRMMTIKRVKPKVSFTQEPSRQMIQQREQELQMLKSKIAKRNQDLQEYEQRIRELERDIKKQKKEVPDENAESDVSVSQFNMQDILSNPSSGLDTYATKFSAIRREFVRMTLSDEERTSPEKKVMAKVVELLEDQPDHRMSFSDLKRPVTEFAITLGLGEGTGAHVIYRLSIFNIVRLDRSDPLKPYVQLA